MSTDPARPVSRDLSITGETAEGGGSDADALTCDEQPPNGPRDPDTIEPARWPQARRRLAKARDPSSGRPLAEGRQG